MNTTVKTTALSLIVALAALVAAPQMAAAEDGKQTEQTAAINYKPMYVYQEPDALETIDELESQFAAHEIQNLVGALDEDDC